MRRLVFLLILVVVAFGAGLGLQGPGLNWVLDFVRGGPVIATLDSDLDPFAGMGWPDGDLKEVAGGGDAGSPLPAGAQRAGAAGGVNIDGTDARWRRVRRRMQELGIVRYSVEGVAGGRVRLRCELTARGGTAAEPIEVESRDELVAAESAVRRAGIWRATEPSIGGNERTSLDGMGEPDRSAESRSGLGEGHEGRLRS